MMGRTSEKSLLTLSSLGSSISHYCPLIDFLSLIYGRKKNVTVEWAFDKIVGEILGNKSWSLHPGFWLLSHSCVINKSRRMWQQINNFTIFWAVWENSNIYFSRKDQVTPLCLTKCSLTVTWAENTSWCVCMASWRGIVFHNNFDLSFFFFQTPYFLEYKSYQ